MNTDEIDVTSDEERMPREQMIAELAEYWLVNATVKDLEKAFLLHVQDSYRLATDSTVKRFYESAFNR